MVRRTTIIELEKGDYYSHCCDKKLFNVNRHLSDYLRNKLLVIDGTDYDGMKNDSAGTFLWVSVHNNILENEKFLAKPAYFRNKIINQLDWNTI